MLVFTFGLLGALSILAVPIHAGVYQPDIVDELAQTGLRNLQSYHSQSTEGGCSLATAIKRKEWYCQQPHIVLGKLTISQRSDLAIPERHDYIRAVKCLQAAPTT